jgi:hypothetical protein
MAINAVPVDRRRIISHGGNRGGLTAMYGLYGDFGGRWADGCVTFSTWGIKVAC